MLRVISYILATAIFTTPWLIGGNWPFTRFSLLGLITAGLFLTFTTLIVAKPDKPGGNEPRVGLPLIWLILVAGCLFTAFQASTTSSWLQQQAGAANPAISLHQTIDDESPESLPRTERIGKPIAAKTNEDIESDFDTAAVVVEVEKSTNRPISVYPPATREKLVDLILAVGVFLLATVVLNCPKRLTPVLIALAASGVAVSFVGILQRLSYNGKVLWQYELVGGGAPFGPFVNGNNAAGFLLIGFSAAMFFIAHKLNTWTSEHSPASLSLDGGGWASDTSQGISSRIIEAVARMESRHLYFLAALTIIVAGVCTSLSRGGMLALACSGILGCFLVTKTNRLVGISLTLIILAGGLALVNYADQSDGIVKELDSLNDLSTAAGPRIQHWTDAIPFAKNNWLLGCGNGTYRLVSPSFDSFFSTKTFAHAESVYVETLVEMGVGGLLLLMATLVLCIAASINLTYRRDAFDRALGTTGIICLVGQMLAAALDFGIYQPANAIAMAALMGGIVGRAAASKRKRSSQKTTPEQQDSNTQSPTQNFTALGLLLMATLAAGWSSYESYGIESRRAGTRTVRLFNELQVRGQKAPSLSTLELAESQLKTAVNLRPDDANANFYLGELSVMRYRHIQTQQLVADLETEIAALEKMKAFEDDESTGEIVARREQIKTQQEFLANIASSQIWNSTALPALHQTFRRAERINPNHAQESHANPDVQAWLQPAWAYYQLSENLCPRLPKTQVRLAMLDIFVPKTDSANSNFPRLSEKERLGLALTRANANTQLLFDCGFLALNSADQKEAVRLWSKCLAFPHRQATEKAIIELCQAELPMRLFFEEVLPQDPYSLTYYMQKYFEPGQRSVPMQLLANHTMLVINRQTEPDSLERFLLLAEVAFLNQDYQTAAKTYAQVEKIDSKPTAETFRYHFALSLFHSKQYDEAMRNVKICELQHYEPRKVKKLLKQIQRERSIKLRSR